MKQMTREEQRVIDKINASVPEELKRKMFRTEKPMEAEKHRIEERLAWGKTLDTTKQLKPENEAKIKNLLKSDTYNQESLVIDERVAQEYERYIGAKMKKAVREGKLNPWKR